MTSRLVALTLYCALASVARAVEPASPPGEGDQRLFVALPVSAKLAGRLEEAQDELEKAGIRWKRSSRENLHLTLLFLGDVPRSKVDELTRVLDGVARRNESFDLVHRGLGYFLEKDGEHMHVIWAGCGDGWKRLADLADDVSHASKRIGLPPRRGAFRSHVTLGYPTDPEQSDEFRRRIDRDGRRDFGTHAVDRFVLYESTVVDGRPVYRMVRSFELE